jgi:two-component system, OmpR family, copper resistance phosphate regulon response regulator CusR
VGGDAVPRLLVIEDEPKLLRALVRGLAAEGYDVVAAADGDQALARFADAQPLDALVLDWMLPGRDGVEVLKHLRRDGHATPVLMLTARDAVADRVHGLDAGADDYLVKPFEFSELLARVRSLLRRGQGGRETVLALGDLSVDLLDRRVTRAGRAVELRPREYEVLVYLLRRKGEVVSREMLGRDVWADPNHPLTNVIDVTVANLRKALDRAGPPLIHTVRGSGFVLGEGP